MTTKFASLFSGCGGLDLGFIQAGFKCIAAFDIDKNAVETYKKNIANHVHQLDIGKDIDEIVSKVKGVDILVAGPPCQGFSTAGKNDPKDLRNSLLLKTAEIAIKSQPRVVLIENVKGLLSPQFRGYLNTLIKQLSDNGYSVTFRVVKATEFGIPQNRSRVIILAARSTQPIDLNFPKYRLKTLKEILSGLESTSSNKFRPLAVDSIEARIAKHIQPGQKLSNVRGGEAAVHTWDIPEVFGHVSEHEKAVLESIMLVRRQKRRRPTGDADPVLPQDISQAVGFPADKVLENLITKGYVRKVDDCFDLTNTFNGKFRRLKWDGLAPTVDTRFGQPRYFLHPTEHRGFSVREAARIQGFPDTFHFDVSDSVAYRLVGNAVPPPMAKAIALLIKKSRF